jgi:hypothetical protein
VAATSEDFVASEIAMNVVAMILVAGAGALQAINGEIQLATGAAGSEVPFATIPFAIAAYLASPGSSTQAFLGVGRNYPIAPKLIPAGTRIAVRSRMSVSNTYATAYTRVYVIGYPGGAAPAGFSTYTLRGQQTGIQKGISKVIPEGSTLDITPGANNWGDWTEVIENAPSELLIRGVAVSPGYQSTVNWGIMELGIGPAGSEVTKARLWFPTIYYCNAHYQYMTRPLLVKPGERLAARIWSSSTLYIHKCQFLYEQH